MGTSSMFELEGKPHMTISRGVYLMPISANLLLNEVTQAISTQTKLSAFITSTSHYTTVYRPTYFLLLPYLSVALQPPAACRSSRCPPSAARTS